MQLEVGKYYRTRDGQKVGPMSKGYDNEPFVWYDDRGGNWSHDGEDGNAVGEFGSPQSGDIIAEWQDDQHPDNMTAVQHLSKAVTLLVDKGHYTAASEILAIMGRLK